MLGVHDGLTAFQQKRIRLCNGISFLAAATYFLLLFYYAAPKYTTVFYECIVGFLGYSFVLLMSYKRQYDFAIILMIVFSILLQTYFAISHGNIDAAEYLLFVTSVTSMIFFRNFKVISAFFLLSFVCFWICKYAFTVIKPFAFMPAGENMYVENHVFTFAFLFLIVNYFLSENKRQEALLLNQNKSLADEKQKSDDLLLNILPYETAEELKKTGTSKAKSYPLTTVLFTDFKDFTNIAEQLSPEELLAEINYCFSAFDAIIDNHKIEKIKTIGDAYMCVGGLPETNLSNPEDVVKAGLEIQEFMKKYKNDRISKEKPYFECRLGINTGAVVAGIVGIKKFAYDIWGDTVNTASRMESSGEVGKVNISGETYEIIKDNFNCTYRGKISAKNKGDIDMYFVESLK